MSSARLSNLLFIIAILVVAGLIIVLAANPGVAVTVEWSTASELDTAGFNLYRGDTVDGPFTQINTDLIPASPDPLIGGSYTFTDTNVSAGHTYYYQLEDVDTNGQTTPQGTVQVTASGGLNPALAIGVGVVAVLLIGGLLLPRRKRPTMD